MKCSNITPQMQKEAILEEKKRLKLLESEGYNIDDAWNTVGSIEKAMASNNKVRAKNIARKHERKFKLISQDDINVLNNNHPKIGNTSISIQNGVIDADGKINYEVTYPNNTKLYTHSSLDITTDQMDATNSIKHSDNMEQGDIEPGKAETDDKAIDEDIEPASISEMFNRLYNADIVDGKMDQLTPEFGGFQLDTMQVYTNTLNAIDLSKINVKIFTNELLNTAGTADTKNNKVVVRLNTLDRNARGSEIFMHEIGHVVAKDVFKNNITERKILEELRDSGIKTGLDYNIFLRRIPDPTSTEIEIAKRKFDRIANAHIDEFYSYITSNEDVWYGFKDVKITSKLIKDFVNENGEETTFQKVMNILVKVINSVWIAMTGRSGTGEAVVARMVSTVSRLVVQKEIADKLKEENRQTESTAVLAKVNKLNDKFSDLLMKKTELIDELGKKSKGPLDKLSKSLKKIAPINALIESNVAGYVWNTVTQDTTKKDVTEMFRVARQSTSFVEKQTNDIKTAIQNILNSKYTDISASTKAAVKNLVVDADMSIYANEFDHLATLLNDKSKLQEEIAKITAEVNDPSLLDQINGLAHYMVHGETIQHNQQMNANNIVARFDQALKSTETEDELVNKRTSRTKNSKKIEAVDKLITLMAIDKTADTDISKVNELIKANKELVQTTMLMHRNYMQTLQTEARVGIFDPVNKGYSKPEAPTIKYRLIPEDEVESQLEVNMKLINDTYEYKILGKNKVSFSKRIAGVKPHVIVDGVKYYMMVGKVKDTGFSEGAIGLISNTDEGIALSSLIRKNSEMSKDKVLTDKVESDIRRIVSGYSTNQKDIKKLLMVGGKTIVPVYAHNGKLIDYRIQMTKIQKAEELDEGTELGQVLANTFSRSTKTELTKQYNKKVIDTIINHTLQGIDKHPDDYTLIEEYTEEDKQNGVKFEKRHERWDMLPDYTKQYIFSELGTNGIAVHKDFSEMMMGEKDVTIGNLRIASFDMKRHPKARARLMALESYIREVLGYVKRTVVIYNAAVVVGNIMSNATVAAIHGIDPITYTKAMIEKWRLLDEYEALNRKLAELKVKAKMGEKGTANKIKYVEAQLKNHEFYSLIKDGQFSPIVEDVNINAKPKGQLYSIMQNAIDKKGGSIAKVINGAKNLLYIDDASKLGKLALKNTQYQDAMTRRVLQEKMQEKADNKLAKDLLEEKNKIKASTSTLEEKKIAINKINTKYAKLRKEKEQEILDYLDQLLVNYGYTMNRYWDYAEKVLGLLFIRYYFGQAKAITAMVTRNPVTSILVGGTQATGAIDLYEPFETYNHSIAVSLGNRMSLTDAPGDILTPNIGDVLGL